MTHVAHAATAFDDNAQRRAFVLDKLHRRGVPESIARFALETAVQLYKAQVKP